VAVAGTSDTEAFTAVPLKAAVNCTLVIAVIKPAVTENVAETAPACTLTVAGTFNAVLDDVSLTVAPPAGAGCASVTTQDAVPSDKIDGALHAKDLIVAGRRMLRLAPTEEVAIAVACTELAKVFPNAI